MSKTNDLKKHQLGMWNFDNLIYLLQQKKTQITILLLCYSWSCILHMNTELATVIVGFKWKLKPDIFLLYLDYYPAINSLVVILRTRNNEPCFTNVIQNILIPH